MLPPWSPIRRTASLMVSITPRTLTAKTSSQRPASRSAVLVHGGTTPAQATTTCGGPASWPNAAACAAGSVTSATTLAQPSEPAFCDQLAALLEAQDCKPYLTRHDGTPHLHYARDGAPLDQWMSAMAVSGLVLYVCRHGRSRLPSQS